MIPLKLNIFKLLTSCILFFVSQFSGYSFSVHVFSLSLSLRVFRFSYPLIFCKLELVLFKWKDIFPIEVRFREERLSENNFYSITNLNECHKKSSPRDHEWMNEWNGTVIQLPKTKMTSSKRNWSIEIKTIYLENARAFIDAGGMKKMSNSISR